MAANGQDEQRLALFIDFENIAIGVRDAHYRKFDVNLVLERLLDKGKLLVKKAYADWSRYSDYKRAFHEAAIELIEVPQKSVGGKNSAAIAALEALREPMETGRVTISRAARQAEYPASFQLIAAMNPCPCGHLGSPLRACRCTPDVVLRYQGRLSGPLLDRIDLQVEVPAVPPDTLASAPDGEPSAQVADRVMAAREAALSRQGCTNARLADMTQQAINQQKAQIAFMAVGGVALALGGVLWFMPKRTHTSERAAYLVPVVQPSGGGFVFGGAL